MESEYTFALRIELGKSLGLPAASLHSWVYLAAVLLLV